MQKEIYIKSNDIDKQYQAINESTMLLKSHFPLENPLAFVHSFGCLQNVTDGEKIKGMLKEMGCIFTDVAEEASIIIYNTCAIRENAEDKVFGTIGRLKHVKQERPNTIIGLCGCMMQEEHVVSRIKSSYPQIDIIFGTHVIHEFPSIMKEFLLSQKRVINAPDSEGVIAENLPLLRDNTFRASVPIMFGCNNYCTYCIVPFVRGRERSRSSDDIVREITDLVNEGYKEITLLGQNVNSYGQNSDENINFAQLLRKINAIDGNFNIRVMTSHPKDITFEVIDTIRDCKKICNHIHLPVQSGSDRILKLMNRKYTVADYIKVIDYAKEQIPDVSFTSDIIVGFPSEDENDFIQTVNLIKRVEFDSIFTFIFSKREGTAAAKMEDPVPYKEKSDRLMRLLAIQKEISSEKNEKFLGKTYKVLVEGYGKVVGEEGYLTGRTDNYLIVDFKGKDELIGSFVDVKVTKTLNWALLGDIIY